jgi:F-type H+-transporting ATPase subunit delta
MATELEDQATLTSYAQALLELADSRQQTDAIAGDVQAIAQVLRDDASLQKYFADPSIGHAERSAKLEHAFNGKTSELLVSFLKLLNAKDRLGQFGGIAQAFQVLLDQRSGNQPVEITVPAALSEQELEDVRIQISTKIGKHARLTQKVDESIIGGLILKIGDKLIDGSVKSQLEQMKHRLVAAV